MATSGSKDPYTWDGLTGWKSYRMLRPFRGMYWDIRRRFPYYRTDITDALTYRAFAATVRMYFVNLLPALAFQLDMSRQTGFYFGINEALFSSALAALVFSTLSCQPLTIVGITGLISLFNYTIYNICVDQGIVHLYPQFIAWVSIWAAITHWIASIGNLCDYMRYITDFSSNSFGMYVGIIYMIKGVEELVDQFAISSPAAGYLSIVVALCYWFTVYGLEQIGSTIIFRPWTRKLLSDYAYPIATIFWTGFVHINGTIRRAEVAVLPISRAFYPTQARSWLVEFWTLPVKWVFVALPIGILLTLLFYYDHNVSSLTAQAKHFPLKKPAGFHWDFFLLGCTSFIGGITGIPLPNGLVPQAPVHTDSCTQYADRQIISHERDEDAPDVYMEHHKKLIVADSVVEQRVSHFLMALALVGTMTGPLLVVLQTMPRALFAGVFFVVGFGGLPGNGITQKVLFLLQERRFIDPSEPLTRVKRGRIALFAMFQIVPVALSVAISQTIAAIGFPVIIMALIPLRWLILPRIFTKHELLHMDAPTADADVVLSSMGGRPELPEIVLARKRGEERDVDGEEAHGVSSGTSEEGKSGELRSREGFAEREEAKAKRELDRDRGFKTTEWTGHD